VSSGRQDYTDKVTAGPLLVLDEPVDVQAVSGAIMIAMTARVAYALRVLMSVPFIRTALWVNTSGSGPAAMGVQNWNAEWTEPPTIAHHVFWSTCPLGSRPCRRCMS
jgi:hypothetical protein